QTEEGTAPDLDARDEPPLARQTEERAGVPTDEPVPVDGVEEGDRRTREGKADQARARAVAPGSALARERLVGLVQAAEAGSRARIARMEIGVCPLDGAPEGALDLLVRGVRGNPERGRSRVLSRLRWNREHAHRAHVRGAELVQAQSPLGLPLRSDGPQAVEPTDERRAPVRGQTVGA